mmetsp:Transcript_5250/g.23600  ORF Transcript_5250/g.23600 Transcript_5250/m.23600 type:complete len:251 (-) Transcript_5250:4957-5709(-)
MPHPILAKLISWFVPQVISKSPRAAALRRRGALDGCGILNRRKRRNLRAKTSELSLSLPLRRILRPSGAFLRQLGDDPLPVRPVVREFWLRVVVAAPRADSGSQLLLEPKRRPSVSFESRIPTPSAPQRFWDPREHRRRRGWCAEHGPITIGRGSAGRVCPLQSLDPFPMLLLQLPPLPFSFLLLEHHPLGAFFRRFTTRACLVGGPPRARWTDGARAGGNRHLCGGFLGVCGSRGFHGNRRESHLSRWG